MFSKFGSGNRRVRRGARRGNKWLNASSVPLRPPRLFFLPESTGSQAVVTAVQLTSPIDAINLTDRN